MKFYDVSLPIKESMITYPGNPSPTIKQYSSIPKDKVNESLICLGSHSGTHVDSKNHIDRDGEGVEELSLQSFFGRCKVIDLTHVEKEIHIEDLRDCGIEKEDIVLLKTKNSLVSYKNFRKDYVHVKIDAAKYLVEVGVKTLGFDYLSVKKFGEDDEVHEVLISNLTLFEGLDLSKVPEGTYTFLGLPLRVSCDGSPSRVLLIED